MTEPEVLEILERVVQRFKNKYKFGYYSEDDIMQEAYIMCLDALERFDGNRPLENFLSVHLRNRLHNLRRNKLGKIVETCQLEENQDIEEHRNRRMVLQIEEQIDSEFSVDLRYDWLKTKAGVKIPRVRTERLKREIRNLVDAEQ